MGNWPLLLAFLVVFYTREGVCDALAARAGPLPARITSQSRILRVFFWPIEGFSYKPKTVILGCGEAGALGFLREGCGASSDIGLSVKQGLEHVVKPNFCYQS